MYSLITRPNLNINHHIYAFTSFIDNLFSIDYTLIFILFFFVFVVWLWYGFVCYVDYNNYVINNVNFVWCGMYLIWYSSLYSQIDGIAIAAE